MKLRHAVITGIAGLLLAVGVSAVSLSQPAAGGAADSAALFAARCQSCHEPPVARAPSRDDLSRRSNREIVEALTGGVMQPMAAGMTPTQIVELAAFLTGRNAAPSEVLGLARAAPPGRANRHARLNWQERE